MTDLPTYTLDELREMRGFVSAQLPDSMSISQQIHQKSATITFRWDKARPVLGDRNDPTVPCSAGLAHLIGEAPGTLLQVVEQLIAVLEAD